MRITYRIVRRSGTHSSIIIWVNGASIGTLTVRDPEELDFLFLIERALKKEGATTND